MAGPRKVWPITPLYQHCLQQHSYTRKLIYCRQLLSKNTAISVTTTTTTKDKTFVLPRYSSARVWNEIKCPQRGWWKFLPLLWSSLRRAREVVGFSCLFSFNFLEDFEANTEVQLKHVHFRVSGCWLQNSSDFMKRHGKIIGKQWIRVVLLEIQPLYYLMITKMNVY